MASTYVNDLRLNELGTGDASGTWGTITNLNLELIGEGLSYGTQDCFTSDADATTTVADGASDPARAMYFKVTSSATLTTTRTLTIAPNTVSRLQFIENATLGGQSINISQGSGSNVTIPTGATKAVYMDGAGSGATVTDAFADLSVATLDTTTLQIGGTSVTATATELNYNDITTLGQVQASKTVTADSNADVKFGDDDKVIFGAGDDLEIKHTALHSDIKETGTGDLRIWGNDIKFYNSAGSKFHAQMITDGATTLYYNGLDKLATTATGIDVTGVITTDGMTTSADINFGDDDKAVFGDGSDLQIYHTGSASIIKDAGLGDLYIAGSSAVKITNGDINEDLAVFNHNGSVDLYYDSSTYATPKLVTKSDGVDITGELQCDSLDVDGVANISGRITATDGVEIPDNANLYLGAGSDLVLFHDGVGGGSYINEQGTGDLNISAADIIFKKYGTSEVFADFNADGAVELYHDGTKKFETTSYGVDISGSVVADTNTSVGVGATPTPDMSTYQNFIWTLNANANLGNPSTEKIGQTGFFVFVQDGTGGRTLSLASEYKTAGGAGLTLSTAANAVDIVPYIVQTTGTILLGTPQLAFS